MCTNSMWPCRNLDSDNQGHETKYDQLQEHDRECVHTYISKQVYATLRHSDKYIGRKEGTKPGHPWQQSGEALHQLCFSTGSKETTMQKPGNNAKAFGLSSQVVHK